MTRRIAMLAAFGLACGISLAIDPPRVAEPRRCPYGMTACATTKEWLICSPRCPARAPGKVYAGARVTVVKR